MTEREKFVLLFYMKNFLNDYDNAINDDSFKH